MKKFIKIKKEDIKDLKLEVKIKCERKKEIDRIRNEMIDNLKLQSKPIFKN